MVMCWAPDCKHYNQRDPCKFFRFSKNPNVRQKWKKLIRRSEEPGVGAYLCSCHFVDGKKENGPTLFLHNANKRLCVTSPEKRKRSKRSTETFDSESTSEDSCSQQNVVELLSSSSSDIASSASSSRDSMERSSRPTSPKPSSSRWSTDSEVELASKNYFLEKELDELKCQSRGTAFSITQIKDNPKLITLYTGLKNYEVFLALYKLCASFKINYYYKWTVEKISKEDQLLMCLMKMRQNFPHEDISFRFKVSQATVSNIIITWIHVIHETLYEGFIKIPSRIKTKSCLPSAFSTFTNCRIILDCTEIATVVHRSSMSAQKLTYSSYKHRNTWKGLIGVAPNGVITFISTLYPGSTSDKKIVQHSGILDHMMAGDLILADKGFLLKDILPAGVHINIPPFLTTPQFTPEQVRQTEKIARARVHVERAIQRIKVFKILDFLPQTLAPFAGKILQVVGSLVNLQNPLIKEVEELQMNQISTLK